MYDDSNFTPSRTKQPDTYARTARVATPHRVVAQNEAAVAKPPRAMDTTSLYELLQHSPTLDNNFH